MNKSNEQAENKPCTTHNTVYSASIDDVKKGKVIIDMRGTEKWILV